MKCIGGKGHQPQCPCRMCINIRKAWARGQEKKANGKVLPLSRGEVKKQGFIKAYTDANRPETFGNAARSAQSVGYSPTTGESLLRDEQVKSGLLAELERIGVNDNFAAQNVKDGMQAEETRFFSDKGKVTDERQVPDWHARAKFQDMYHKLKGDFPKDEPIQLASLILKIGNGPASPEEWQRIAEEERKIGEILAERLEQEGYSGNVEEHQKWRSEAKAQVRAELATPKVPEQLKGPAE